MAEQKQFDVAVIGGGPGGYPAAIRAAQNGATVALIEAEHMGGTCLNWGCIPTKALIARAEALRTIRHSQEFGITTGPVEVDFASMSQAKGQTVSRMRKNLDKLVEAHQVHIFRGFGQLTSPREIKVQGTDSARIEAKSIILATGSEPLELPSMPFDGEFIHSSDTILDWKTLPKSLVIVGGGVIGCEFASLYAELGVRVTILEALPDIIATETRSVTQALRKSFKDRGIDVQTSVRVEKITPQDNGVQVTLSEGDPLFAEKALIAVGRKLRTHSIGLENAGVLIGSRGEIPVDEKMETNVSGIYAIGDITAKWQLAHVATHQGMIAANNATGHSSVMHYNAVPSVIFTHPEIASVGMTPEKAQEKGYDITMGTFPYQALGKAMAALHTEGFAQIVADRSTGEILGAQVMGYEASNLISEMTLAIANELTLDCVIDTIHAHPTLGEIWLEAALLAKETPLHLPPKRKRKTREPAPC